MLLEGFESSEIIGSYYDAQCLPRSCKERLKKNGVSVKLETILCRYDKMKKVYFLLERLVQSETTAQPDERTYLANAIDYHSFIAHEVRNPLAGIDSTAHLIIGNVTTLLARLQAQVKKNTEDDRYPALKQELDQILNDTDHILSCSDYIQIILKNNLDLTKLETNTLELSMTHVDIQSEVIVPCLYDLEWQRSENVDVRIEVTSTLFALADKMRLRQVLYHIISNSFKHTSTGEVSIHVSAISSQRNVTCEKSGNSYILYYILYYNLLYIIS